jgi:hypothetical protein
MTPEIPFRRNVVQPVECLKNGYELIKDRYWLFVGITLVGLLIGQAVPLGILLGPMMCGMNLTFFAKRRGQPIEFAMLFKGFDYFGPSLIATLLYMIPITAIVVGAYVMFYVGMFVTMAATQGSGEPNPGPVFGLFGVFILVWIVVMLVIVVLSIGFTFSYPLIVDRKLQGLDAVKLSFKAAMSNFWRLLGMSILVGLLHFAGFLVACVGIYLVMPIGYAAIAAAYEQAFGLSSGEDLSNLPPPPPTFT